MDSNTADILYEAILKQLLKLKNNGPVPESIENISVLGSDIRLKVQNVRVDSACPPEMLQLKLSLFSDITIIKTFLEILLLLTEKGQMLKELFLKIFDEGFFESILLANHTSITLRYSLSELLSFFIFASYKVGITQSYYEKIMTILHNPGDNLMFILYTLYHLCTLSDEYGCDYFDEFISGVLHGIYLQKHYVDSDDKAQLLILRIFSKILSIDCDKSREALCKNIDSIIFLCKTAKTTLVSKSFWSFVHVLFPFPKSPVGFVISANTCLNIIEELNSYLKEKCDDDKEAFTPHITIIINLILKSVLWISDELHSHHDVVVSSLCNLKSCVDSLDFESDETCQSNCVAHTISLFMDEDDELIDFLLLQLELFLILQIHLPENRLYQCLIFNPHQLFIKICSNLSYDSSIFLDWLVSNETKFLTYLAKYLKYLATTWENFTDQCDAKSSGKSSNSTHTESSLNSCASTLIRLKYSIVKLHKSDLFPYSPGPLIKLLTNIENLFESD